MTPHTILVKNGRIIDGTGKAAYKGDLSIQGEKISAVGKTQDIFDKEIDASGMIVCPGFVDPHSHADVTLLNYPEAENLVMQGITTVLAGNCGMSLAPFKRDTTSDFLETVKQALHLQDVEWRSFNEWLSHVEQTKISINYAPLVGHSMLRTATMGLETYRPATQKEITEMKQLTIEAMGSGAFGLSAGLDGAWPGAYAEVEEIVEIAKVAQEFGGFYAPHTRFHQNQWPASHPDEYGYGVYHGQKGEIFAGRYHGLIETIEISRKANRIPVNIAHFTPAYILPIPHPDYLAEAIARATLEEVIDRAWDEGLKIMFNVVAWQHHIGGLKEILSSFFSAQLARPDWLKKMGKDEFVHNLKSRQFRDQVKEFVYSGTFKFFMVNPASEPYWMDNSLVMVCNNPDYQAKTIGEIARTRQPGSIKKAVYDESVEVLFDILVDDPNTKWVHYIDLRHYRVLPIFLKHHAASPCTDGFALSPQLGPDEDLMSYGPCPNYWSLFPHYIKEFVRERETLTLEEAIMKATYVPAKEVLGLEDRGVIKPGAYADLVIFDANTVGEAGDYIHPNLPPHGIKSVLVNGTVVYENKKHSGAKTGRVLRHC